jgi:PAS domain S-box-containing protein
VVVSLVAFVHLYFGTGRLWLGIAAVATRFLSLVINFLVPTNVTHGEITGLRHIEMLGQTITLAEGVVSPWVWVGRVSILLLIAFVVDSAVGTWRGGTSDGRRRAVTLGGSLFVFLFAATLHAALVMTGTIESPYLISLFYLGCVAAMGSELSRDVVRAAELGVRLQQSEREVLERDARLQLIIDSAMDAMITVDEAQRIVQFNAAAEAMFGCSASAVLGQPFEQFVPERLREQHRAHVRQYIESGTTSRTMGRLGQISGVRSDGEEFPIEASISQVTADAGKLMTVILRDCTERRRAETDAQVRRAEIAHLSRVALMAELSGSVAHELNQPLGAILSNAEAMRRLLERDDPDFDEIHEILEDIISDDQRAGEVIRRLRLLLSRGELQLEAIDLSEVVQGVLGLVHFELTESRVTLRTDFDNGRARVMGDQIQLQQVVLNLVMNASDAMATVPPDQRILTVRTERLDDDSVCLSVSDTGHGISASETEDIFRPFVTTKPQGMGMGLAICRTIAAAHGGRLSTVNNADAGATFQFTIPACDG